jgi:hypothetical protein
MRRRTRGMLFLVLLTASGAVVAACESTTGSPSGVQSTSSADVVDVRSGSRASLALRGGLGPIVSGQTITKATVSLDDLQLVDANGGSVALSNAPFTGDLIALQDQLGPIFSAQSIQTGQYAALRFRLRSAWIEAQDTQGVTTVYASQGVDTSQFAQGTSVQTLQLAGLDSNGFVTCALPQGGIVVDGETALALQFALAQSLVVQSSGAWVLTPRCWLVDQGTFSSLDVDYQVSSEVSSSEQYFSSGFQVMLLDSNLWPVCEVPLAAYQSVTFRAHFVYLEAFQGPFVAALVPPPGYALQSSVAFSVDVQQSAACSASISVTSFQVVSGRSFDIGTDNRCHVVQRDPHGHVLAQTNEPIGAVEDVAPTMHHHEPVASGEEEPQAQPPPQLPGNPPPKMGHGHGMQPPATPSSTSTGPEMMPPAPSSTSHGHMRPTGPSSAPSSAPTTAPGTAPSATATPPATTSTGAAPSPGVTVTQPPPAATAAADSITAADLPRTRTAVASKRA